MDPSEDMTGKPESQVTDLLRLLRGGGDPRVERELVSLLYDRLRALARSRMRAAPAGHTLQPTAIVHEAWIRIHASEQVRAATRGQFLALAARAMRSVLLDHARAKQASKRGGPAMRITFSEDLAIDTPPSLDALALEEALSALAAFDDRAARVFELCYFGGATRPEAAEVLGIGLRTAEKDYKVAKLWLVNRLGLRKA